ncbi:MAG: hypothetical protein RIM23_17180 [Coleofasciculus sp. G3-WIS-01]|uniref:hypothetical protein n=1 Tax=Coleofasciculus sp. G3-WIS-01 TaxID=3069528 RepID=UPI003303E8C9
MARLGAGEDEDVETCHGTSGSRGRWGCRDVPWHVWELGRVMTVVGAGFTTILSDFTLMCLNPPRFVDQ